MLPKRFSPLRHDLDIHHLAGVIVFGDDHDNLVADVKILIVLAGKVSTQTVGVILNFAEHTALVFAGNNGDIICIRLFIAF